METLEEWSEELKNHTCLILVEGKKDKTALNNLGIKNILDISGKPHYKYIDIIIEIKPKFCVILFDLDKEGKKLYSKFKNQLQKSGIKVDTKFREFLFKNTKLSQIEGIESYLRKNQ